MRSVFMMSLANIRKRKAQSILIGLTILVSALMLSTAIGVLENINDPFDEMFEKQKASHITMQIEDKSIDVDKMVSWWREKEAIESVNFHLFFGRSEKLHYNGIEKSMGDLMLTEHPGQYTNQDILYIVEGADKNSPGTNEMWLPTGYAYAWGISVGDSIGVSIDGEFIDFEVSAIVVDPQYSASMINPVRVWVEKGTLTDRLEEESLAKMVGLRFDDISQYDALWIEFEEYLGMPFPGFKFDYEFMAFAYGLIQNILGIIMLIFSVIIILVAIFVIGFTISNSIISDYKIIGILKAQGFSSNNIKGVYALQYFLISAIAVPIGIFTSRYLVFLIMKQMIKSLGITNLNNSILIPALITFVSIFVVIFFVSLWNTGKAGRINPAEAIRNNMSKKQKISKRRFDISKIKNLPVTFILSLKLVVSERKNTYFIIVSSVIMSFVLVFSINTYNSVSRMDQNYAFWGFDSAEIYITRESDIVDKTNNDIINIIKKDSRVKAVVPYSAILDCAIPAQNGKTSENLVGFTYDGDMDGIGILNLEGKNPVRNNEVSISILVANKYEKNIGDYIDIFIYGEEKTYLITGIYQSLNAMGWGFRIQEDTVRSINPEYNAHNFSVKLINDNEKNQLVMDMKDLLGPGYNIRNVEESGEINLSSITASMALVTVILSMIFIIVAFIITFNTTIMSIYHSRKTFGIYKSIGMTQQQIRYSLLWKSGILSLIGSAIGIPISLIVSPKVLSMLITNLGMVEFPFIMTWTTLLAIPICIGIAIISTWLPSKKILSINPRNLIVE
ncbi:putative ABC transport system permease protein [Natranaerovirga pectinivora]|uniref:Putative ABC transport system permease protein n=1 Tax=Natranaerovirga pectinivora TaxID=682400 RepID=A0A4R3MMJ3_9FIRM|nr:FtsX-like permease family protein [Natranaerovirga pectinivora]TCT15475.1 putative ABC transport system permease protein [Natranaerovirga pectinivora]